MKVETDQKKSYRLFDDCMTWEDVYHNFEYVEKTFDHDDLLRSIPDPPSGTFSRTVVYINLKRHLSIIVFKFCLDHPEKGSSSASLIHFYDTHSNPNKTTTYYSASKESGTFLSTPIHDHNARCLSYLASCDAAISVEERRFKKISKDSLQVDCIHTTVRDVGSVKTDLLDPSASPLIHQVIVK